MAAVLGLGVVAAACGGGGDDSEAIGEIKVAPAEDVQVNQDRNPIVARNSPVLAVNPTQRTNANNANAANDPAVPGAIGKKPT